MKEIITDVLDALGLLAGAAGAGLAVAGIWLGSAAVGVGVGLLTAGAVVVGGSILMARLG